MNYFKKITIFKTCIKTILQLLLIITLFPTEAYCQGTNKAYWVDTADNSRPWRLILKPGENKTIRLKAEVPANKTLKAYSFTLSYDPSIIAVESVDRPLSSEFPPMNINDTKPGSIIFNAFNTKGLKGYTAVSLLDITVRAKLAGDFNFLITVHNFGSDSTDQFNPEPDLMSVFVSPEDVSVIRGDINHDGSVNLIDEILAAQIISGIIIERPIYVQADVNMDYKIGIQEMIYILNNISMPAHIPGDINGDRKTDLTDAVLALQILCNINIDSNIEIFKQADINGDEKIGMEEAVYILGQVSNFTHIK